MGNILKKILKDPTMMTWSAYFIQFGSGVFVLPLVLAKFSEIEISYWFLLNTILGISRLADSGFGPTLVRAVSYFKAGADKLPRNVEEYKNNVTAEGDPNYTQLANVLSTTRIIYIAISLFLVIILLTAGIAIIWNLMNMADHATYLWVAYGLLVMVSFLTIQTIRWSSIMTGLDFVAEINGFKSFIGAVKVISFVVLLLLNLNITYLIGVMLIEALAVLIYLRRFVYKWYKEHGVQLNSSWYFDRDIFRSIWPATWKTGGIFWGNYLTNYGTSIIVAQISDVRLMASFLFTQRIFMFIRRISEAPFYANLPKVYKVMASKDNYQIKKSLSIYLFYSLGLIILALLFTGFFGNILLELLNIETRLVPALMLTIMALGLVFEMNSSFHSSIYLSTNHVPFLIPSIATGIGILGFGFLVVGPYGLLGIVVMQFVVQWIINFWYSTHLSFKLIHWNLPTYFHDLFKFGLRSVREKTRSLKGMLSRS